MDDHASRLRQRHTVWRPPNRVLSRSSPSMIVARTLPRWFQWPGCDPLQQVLDRAAEVMYRFEPPRRSRALVAEHQIVIRWGRIASHRDREWHGIGPVAPDGRHVTGQFLRRHADLPFAHGRREPPV